MCTHMSICIRIFYCPIFIFFFFNICLRVAFIPYCHFKPLIFLFLALLLSLSHSLQSVAVSLYIYPNSYNVTEM